MPNHGPKGVITDLNIIQKRIGRLIRDLQRDKVTASKTLSTLILANLTAANVSIQAVSAHTNELSATPVLPLRDVETTDAV